MDIRGWLRSLDLERYRVFRENDIDETVLPNLTAEDLKELGVASLGRHRKLLDAIAALRADTSAKGAAKSVMFSGLVGSTALWARMDPEDQREVILPTRTSSLACDSPISTPSPMYFATKPPNRWISLGDGEGVPLCCERAEAESARWSQGAHHHQQRLVCSVRPMGTSPVREAS